MNVPRESLKAFKSNVNKYFTNIPQKAAAPVALHVDSHLVFFFSSCPCDWGAGLVPIMIRIIAERFEAKLL